MKLLKYLPLITSFFVFVIYFITLAPSVIQIDSGELAAVQLTLGIAHPTGYPLFTILGFLWSNIPSPFTNILHMNILAAVLCSASAGLFVSSSILILNSKDSITVAPKKQKKGKKKEKVQAKEIEFKYTEFYFIIASLSASLVLAFSRTFWFQSTSVEVYSLHLFLIMLVIFFLLRAYFGGGEGIMDKHWIIFSLVLGLSFTNHMTTILILPGAAYLYFKKYGLNRRSLERLALMILAFIPVLILIYAYLPIRSAQNPQINWGNPVDLKRILWHISGKQYQTWLFSSTESAKKQLVYFFTNLPSEFGFSLFLITTGVFLCYRYSKKIFVFISVCFVTTVLYSINYDIVDIDTYFLLAYVSLAFFSVFAFLQVLKFLKDYKSAILVSAILIFIQAYLNFGDVNQSGNFAFEDYTKAVLSSVPENSIIFGYQWDYLISPSYYFQFAEGIRKDVVVIDKELLRRSWYYNQLKNNYPGVLKGITNQIKTFNEALSPFEEGGEYDPNLLERSYRALMTGLVSTNVDTRNFYITPELVEAEMSKGQFSLPEGYTIVPDLFYFRVVKGKAYIPAADPVFNIRLPEYRSQYQNNIELFVGSMLARRALYEMQFDKRERAMVYIKKLKTDLPDYRLPAALTAAFN